MLLQDPDTPKDHAMTATPWHSLETEEILKKLVTTSKGLDPDEAARRLHEYGKMSFLQKSLPGLQRSFFISLKAL